MSAFFDLLGMPPKDFFSTYWMRQPVLLKPEKVNLLFRVDETMVLNWFEKYAVADERFLTFSAQDADNAAARVRLINFIKQGGQTRQRLDALLDKESFIINKLGTTSPYLAYCDQLAKFCKAVMSVNCYMTRSSSFRYLIHHDKHEIFAIQSCGRKRWKFWPPSTFLPIDLYTGYADQPVNEPAIILEVSAGEVIYIPSGWRHEAEAIEGTSVHFSLGIRLKRWVELLRDLIEHTGAKQDVLRDIVPMNVTEDGFFYHPDNVPKLRLEDMDDVINQYNGGNESGEILASIEPFVAKDPNHQSGNPMLSRFCVKTR